MNYATGKIYKVINDQTNDIYIGSTCQPLYKRMSSHRNCASKHPERKIYKLMNEIGNSHFNVILIENFPTDSKDKLRAREQYHIDLHKPSLNAIGAVFNDAQHKLYQKNFDKQYRLDNKEWIKQRNAQYHADNYELLNKKHNCTCGGEYTHKHKTMHLKSRKHIDYLARLDAPAP